MELEKKKVEVAKAHDMCEVKEITGANGDVVTVRTHIPYEQKREFANRFVTLTTNEDEELGISNPVGEEVWRVFLQVHYYTDIDTTDDAPADVFDYMVNNHLMDELVDIIRSDYMYVRDMIMETQDFVFRRFEAENSLAYMVKRVLGGDINLENAETRELIEKLIDMKAAYDKQEAEANVLQFGQKKKAAGAVKTGGVHIQLGKK